MYLEDLKYDRNGGIVEVWMLVIKMNGFTSYMYVQGTEDEMLDYMESEIPTKFKYYALTEYEIKMVKRLDQKIFIAPQH